MSQSPWAAPGWGQPPPPRAGERLRRADAYAAVVTAALVVLLGAPAGLLWGALAPRVAVVKVAQGIDLQMPETKAFVGADASFLLITLLVGVACGLIAAYVGRRSAPGVAVGVAVGGILAALVAMTVGHRLGYDAYSHLRDVSKVGTTGSAYLQLRAKGVLMGWPIAASLTLLVVTAIRTAATSDQPPVT